MMLTTRSPKTYRIGLREDGSTACWDWLPNNEGLKVLQNVGFLVLGSPGQGQILGVAHAYKSMVLPFFWWSEGSGSGVRSLAFMRTGPATKRSQILVTCTEIPRVHDVRVNPENTTRKRCENAKRSAIPRA